MANATGKLYISYQEWADFFRSKLDEQVDLGNSFVLFGDALIDTDHSRIEIDYMFTDSLDFEKFKEFYDNLKSGKLSDIRKELESGRKQTEVIHNIREIMKRK